MSSRNPRVSVGLPVYNGEQYVEEAIKSTLSQTFTDFELVISDNASTDRTPEICKDYASRDGRIRYYRNDSNLGAAKNFNRVFELSRGEYFKWAAHDDLCHPSFIEVCVRALDSSPDAVLCFGKTKIIDNAGQHVGDYDPPFLDLTEADRSTHFLALVLSNHIVVEIFGIIRTEQLRRTPLIGSYVGSDIVLLAHLALFGPFINAKGATFYHREHSMRSTYANPDMDSRGVWFDTNLKGKRTFPTWRRTIEHLRTLVVTPLPFGKRVRLAFGVLRKANWIRSAFVREIAAVTRRSGGD